MTTKKRTSINIVVIIVAAIFVAVLLSLVLFWRYQKAEVLASWERGERPPRFTEMMGGGGIIIYSGAGIEIREFYPAGAEGDVFDGPDYEINDATNTTNSIMAVIGIVLCGAIIIYNVIRIIVKKKSCS